MEKVSERKTPDWITRGFISKEKYEAMRLPEKIDYHFKLAEYGVIVMAVALCA